VKDLTTPEIYAEAVRDVKLFLEGRQTDLVKSLRERMSESAEAQEFERAARYRDLVSTVEQLQEKQRIAAAEGDDADVFGYHYENQNAGRQPVPHARRKSSRPQGILLGRSPEFAQIDETNTNDGATGVPARPAAGEFHPAEFFSALLKQLYLAQPYVPRNIYVPVDFEDREELEEALSDQLAGEAVEPRVFTSPSRSAETNANSSISPAPTPSNLTTSASES